MTVDQYIETYKNMAIDEMDRSGIPASITLAQGILESSYGNSELARYANNHFGIKCHGDWYGGEYYLKDDDRDKKGNLIRSCFRVYSSAYESYVNHTEFLMGKQRYAFLFNFPKEDYISWARGLKTAGYATNPVYADKLIRVVEENNLHQYDYMTNKQPVAVAAPAPPPTPAPAPPPPVIVEEPRIIETIEEPLPTVSVEEEVMPEIAHVGPSFPKGYQSGVFKVNDVKVVSAKDGDTPSDLAARHNVPLAKILKFNDLKQGDELVTNQYIYLQPKRGKYSEPRTFHRVKEEDNMYVIAQLYGIKLENLKQRNLLTTTEEPAVGEKIYLSGKTTRKPDLRQGTRVTQPIKIETEKPAKPAKPTVEEKPKKYPKAEEPKPEAKGNPLASITDKFKPKPQPKPKKPTLSKSGRNKSKDARKNDKNRIYDAVTTKTAKELPADQIPEVPASTTEIKKETVKAPEVITQVEAPKRPAVQQPVMPNTSIEAVPAPSNIVVETPVVAVPEASAIVEIPETNTVENSTSVITAPVPAPSIPVEEVAVEEPKVLIYNSSPTVHAGEVPAAPVVETPVYSAPAIVETPVYETPSIVETPVYEATTIVETSVYEAPTIEETPTVYQEPTVIESPIVTEEASTNTATTVTGEDLVSEENYYIVIDEHGQPKKVPFGKKPAASKPVDSNPTSATSTTTDVVENNIPKEHDTSIYETIYSGTAETTAPTVIESNEHVTPATTESNEHITTSNTTTAVPSYEASPIVGSTTTTTTTIQAPTYSERVDNGSIAMASAPTTTDYYASASQRVDEGNYGRRHMVDVGDTLYSLAIRYDVDIQSIRVRNGIEANNIKVGQELLID